MAECKKSTIAAVAVAILSLVICAAAQAVPWVQYVDAESSSVCEVVNAANLELVVLFDTGELAGITGEDVIFADTFVDSDGFVSFLGFPAGYIEFAFDADGFRTLWWFTDDGFVADVDIFTGEPTSFGDLPIDFGDVPCDACPFWDFPEECIDSDGDGVEDAFDLCPDTPLDLIAEDDGCACEELDGDLDDINACFDLCPDTPFDEFADFDGCSCSQLDDDLDSVDNCFDLCPDTPLNLLTDVDGCACENLDGDLDGINACFDLCPNTPFDELADIDGCSCSQFVGGCGPIEPGGGAAINLCGSFSAMIFGVMLCGLTGMRRGPTRR